MTFLFRCVLATVAAGSGLALAGCASSPSPSTPAGSGATASASRSATPTMAGAQPSASAAGSTMPGGPVASATGQPAARTAECTSAQLKVAYTDNAQIRNGALNGMSHADSVITFTNVSSATCWIRGYPGVSALDSSGRQVKQAVRGPSANGQIPLITLAPGQVASAEITGNTASCSSLARIAAILITVPDERVSTRLAGPRELCLNSLGIAPVQRGDAAGLSL
ncbi:MAG TPA: DUF4232 domain-containing protein [Streptosporangiaceae bacterium]